MLLDRKVFFIAALCVLSSALVARAAAPSFTVGTASGTAGSTVNLSVNYDPSTSSVAGIQFNLMLTSQLSTGTVTPGTVVNNAGKSISTLQSGTTWTFIIFGFNQTTIGTGNLLTAQILISSTTAAGTIPITVTGLAYTDPNGKSIPLGKVTNGSITVNASTSSAPVIISSLTATAIVNSSYSYQITATNNPTGYGAVGFPKGLSFNSSKGLLSGTPTAVGTSTIALTATNAAGTGKANLVLSVNYPVPILSSISPSTATMGGSGFTLTVNGSNFVSGAVIRWNGLNQTTTFVSSSRLTTSIPASDIVNAGTAVVGVYNSSPGGGLSNTLNFTINPHPPVITSVLTATGTANSSFSYQITATRNPTSYGATSLPSGLVVSSTTGLISGKAVVGGTFTVTISATNGGGTGSAALSLTMSYPVPTLSSITPSSATVGGSSFTMTVNGTNFATGALVRWNGSNRTTTYVKSTKLTATILASDIKSTGTAIVSVFNPTPGGGTSNSKTFTMNSLPPVITSVLTASGTVNSTFRYQIMATNNPTSFGATGLPSGLAVSTTTGLISGTPTVASTLPVTISAINAGGTGQASWALTINNPVPTLTIINPSSTTAGGSAFTLSVTGTNFLKNSVVRWNGSNLATTYVKSTSLTATVPASDIVSSGTARVLVFNATPGGGTSTTMTFTITAKSLNPGDQPGVLLVPADLTAIRVYPNPWRVNKHSALPVTFDNLPSNTSIKIFTASGRWIKSLPLSSTSVAWDLTNDSGEKVASGLYMYLITTDSGLKKTGQLAIIR